MRSVNLVLVGLLILGAAVTTAYVANELSSEGTVDIEEPEEDATTEDTAEESTSDEPVDVSFEETDSATRTANFHGTTAEQGDTITDEFIISNNHDEELSIEFQDCTDFPKTYSVGPDPESADEIDGTEFYPPVNEDIYVEVAVEIPEDAEPGSQDLCTDITAAPS